MSCLVLHLVMGIAFSRMVDDSEGSSREALAAKSVARGMQLFRANRIAESLKEFDRAAELEPQSAPQLWQRGISDYYLGRFAEGQRQFELHRRVNPDDVENAAWHFLCVARREGIDAARKKLIPIDLSRDPRVPMAEIYRLYAGQGPKQAVLDAAKRADNPRAQMYAHLYLGLYEEATGHAAAALDEVRKAAAVELDGDYMRDVARVHVLQREKNARKPRT